MRKKLRHSLRQLRTAGVAVDDVYENGSHTVVALRDGQILTLSRGSRESPYRERRLRSVLRQAAKQQSQQQSQAQE
jgi:hypothetical protein